MTGLYNRTEIPANTRAVAAGVNAEFIKIQQAIAEQKELIDGLVSGTPLASYTWVAFADSADGSANFTTGEPGSRTYIGLAYNRGSATESAVASDYTWTRFQGADGGDGEDGEDGEDGQDGVDGNYVDFRFIRSSAAPSTPIGATPAGWSDSIPTGTNPLWFTKATKNATGGLLSVWSDPARITSLGNPVPYNAGDTYYEGELVTFGGGTYILIVPTSAGNSPTGTDQANSYWDVIAAPGAPGAPATPPSAFSATIDLTSSATGANLRTIADAGGYTGMSDATVTFRVPSGVTISGNAYGGKGIDTGTWPADYTIDLALVVQSGGKVYGGGGNGGNGGSGAAGGFGGAGGDAVYAREDIDVTIDSGGEVKGGGGGGQGGTGATTGFPEPSSTAGGGGGGGFPNGNGGDGGYGDGPAGFGQPGSSGGVLGGGAGGAGDPTGGARNGSTGGNAAAVGSGSLGGAAGYAVRKNGNTVPVTNNGTMTGTAA